MHSNQHFFNEPMKIICILMLCFVMVRSGTVFQFPRILWTFWDSGYPGMKLFTRLCVNNMAHFSRKSNWEFRFITDSNLSSHISPQNMQRLDTMLTTSKQFMVNQNRADLIRLFLLYEHGGMWLDASSFFINDLSWIQHMQSSQFVYNKPVSTPQIVTFTYDSVFGGNQTIIYDQKTKQNFTLFPGVQIWSFIAKPKCKFLTDVINHLQTSLKRTRQQLDEQSQKLGILYGREKDPYFFTGTYQFVTVLQKTQKMLQAEPTSKHKYAVEYYQMWSLRAQQTALGLFSAMRWYTFYTIYSIFTYSAEQLSEWYGLGQYFVKFNGGNYPHINNAILYNQYISCLGLKVGIKKQSLLNKYLFEVNKEVPEVQHYYDVLEDSYLQTHECASMDRQVMSLKNKIGSYVWWAIAIFLSLNLSFIALIVFQTKKTNKKE